MIYHITYQVQPTFQNWDLHLRITSPRYNDGMKKTILTLSMAALAMVVSAQVDLNAIVAQRTERLISLELIPNTVNVEAYYNGTSFSGGGIMQAIGRYRVRELGKMRIVARNVSHLATWTSNNPFIVPIDTRFNLYPDGLYIYPGDYVNIGTAGITARLGSFTANGQVTVWAD